MLAFPGMLVSAAQKAGINVPPTLDGTAEKAVTESVEDYKEHFPHFYVFCMVQLCQPMVMGEQWDNARVVASVPTEDIKSVTVLDLIARGLSIQT